MRYIILVFFICCQMIVQGQVTQVDIVSTLHKIHSKNPNYSYDDLQNYIESEKPDIIAVEIRAEDLQLPKDSLAKRYPLEMYSILHKNKSVIYYGIDWYGDDIVGKPFPKNYFERENSIKLTQQKMNKDSEFVKKLMVLQPLIKKKGEMANSYSLLGMKSGLYDAINEIYYEQLAILCKDTPYETVPNFYQLRDLRLAENTAKIIEKHPGKKIMVLTGADHRFAIVKYLESKFGKLISFKN